MSQAKVIWNNGASLHLGELLSLEYVDETYKVLQDALLYFQRVHKAEKDERIAAARVKLSEWKHFAAIFLASHLAHCDEHKTAPEFDLNSALDEVQRNPSVIVEVLTLAIKSFGKSKDEESGEEVA
jgi:hypothetical protein